MKTARIYAFGDSLTYGAWDSQGGWCDRLKRKLHNLTITAETGAKFQMFNLGIGGENSRSLLKRFQSEIETRNRPDWPPVILIGTGANDTRYTETSGPAVSAEEYRANLEALVSIAKKYTDKILLVGVATVEKEVQPFKTTFLSNDLLRKYYQVMSEVADHNHIVIVNVNSGLGLSNQPIFFKDGVHLNDMGHEIIANLIWPELEKLLNS